MNIKRISTHRTELTVSNIEFKRIQSALESFLRHGGGDLAVVESLLEYIADHNKVSDTSFPKRG